MARKLDYSPLKYHANPLPQLIISGAPLEKLNVKSNIGGSKLNHLNARLSLVFVAMILAACGQDTMKSGAEFMDKGEYPSAVIEFKNAVQANPESAEARIALANALERSSDLVGTEQQVRRALERGGDPDILTPRIATLLLERGELAALIKEFKDKSLKSPGADSSLKALVALAFLSQKQVPSAENQLKGVTEETATVKLARAQLLLSRGMANEALAELSLNSASTNDDWWTMRAISRIYQAMNDRPKALDAIQRAQKAAPWHRGLMGEYGEALVSVGNIKDAIPLRNQLKRIAPNYFWTHYLDALVLASEGRNEDSHAAALKVLRVSPDHLPAALLAASGEFQTADYQMANTRLTKVLNQHPRSLAAQQLLAAVQLRLGRVKEASETIQHGLVDAPKDARLLSIQAELDVTNGNTAKAAATLETLIAGNPKDIQSRLRLSELKLRAGDKAAAAALLDSAAEMSQDDPAMRDQIIALSLRNGDTKRVRQLADQAMASRPKDPQSHLTLAAALAGEKDPAGAWKATLAALDIDPGFSPALAALSSMAVEPSQKEELRARFAKAVDSTNTSAPTYVAYARLLASEQGDQSKIVPMLEKGVIAVPTSIPLRSVLVDEHMRAGNADAALSVAQTGASTSNAPPEALALLANTYERIGKVELAAETYRKLAANYPQRADWRLKLAHLEIDAKHMPQATTLLRGLITDRPFDSTAYVALANLTAKDNLAEALSIAKELGQREPHKLAGLMLEGDSLTRAGKLDEAIVKFSQAGKAGAEPSATLSTIGVLELKGQTASADSELAQALRKYPNHAAVMSYAAQRALSQGKPDTAVEWLQKVVATNPRNPIALNELAWAQVQAGHPKALETAQLASQLLPDNPMVLDTLGMAQAKSGQTRDALATFRLALNLAPNQPSARLHLAQQLAAGGDTQGASQALTSLDTNKLSKGDQAEFAGLQSKLPK